MSFDLYVFDVDRLPASDRGIAELLEADSEGDSDWDGSFSSRIEAFVAELEEAFPDSDDDPNSSPWASWPLHSGWMLGGRCCAFNIKWSAADRMDADMRPRARRHGLTLYDPQSGDVVPPERETPLRRRGLFGRARGR